MKRSTRTTYSGLTAALAMAGIALAGRLDAPQELRDALYGILAVALAGLGIAARDDKVSSEGTDARLRHRGGSSPDDPPAEG